jgi:antitoxin MazE
MTMQLTRIWNSLGIRIPKAIIELAGLEGRELELKVVKGGLLLRPRRGAREGWEEAFRAMHEAGEDRLATKEAANRFDEEEWEW